MAQRQITLYDLPRPQYVSFGIRKVEKRRWKIVKHTIHPDSFKVQLSRTLFVSERAYVFSLGLNELYGEFHFELIAKFSNRQWAQEFMASGKVDCINLCIHDKECRQRKPPIANLSPFWQHTYFILYNKKVQFYPYTLINGERCCKIG